LTYEYNITSKYSGRYGEGFNLPVLVSIFESQGILGHVKQAMIRSPSGALC